MGRRVSPWPVPKQLEVRRSKVLPSFPSYLSVYILGLKGCVCSRPVDLIQFLATRYSWYDDQRTVNMSSYHGPPRSRCDEEEIAWSDSLDANMPDDVRSRPQSLQRVFDAKFIHS